jgi:hypothetical protein
MKLAESERNKHRSAGMCASDYLAQTDGGVKGIKFCDEILEIFSGGKPVNWPQLCVYVLSCLFGCNVSE